MVKPKLIPPDRKRCQAEIPSGNTFMTMGGLVGARSRCANKPAVIVHETKTSSEDGQLGSMSLCEHCLGEFKKDYQLDKYKVSKITFTYRVPVELCQRVTGYIVVEAASPKEAEDKAADALQHNPEIPNIEWNKPTNIGQITLIENSKPTKVR